MRKLAELLGTEFERRVELAELPPECKEARAVLEIRQGFIHEVLAAGQPHCDVRIRHSRDDSKSEAAAANPKYTLTAKFRPLQHEAETEISREMFSALWPGTTKKQEKKRCLLASGWVVDEMSDKIVAEFEYGKGGDGSMPAGFKEKKL